MLVSSAQRNESPLCIHLSSLLAFLLIEVTPDGVGGFPGGSDGKESTCNAGDQGSIPRLERSPFQGEGHGNPTPMDRGAWQATVSGVSKSWTKHAAHTVLPICSVALDMS